MEEPAPPTRHFLHHFFPLPHFPAASLTLSPSMQAFACAGGAAGGGSLLRGRRRRSHVCRSGELESGGRNGSRRSFLLHVGPCGERPYRWRSLALFCGRCAPLHTIWHSLPLIFGLSMNFRSRTHSHAIVARTRSVLGASSLGRAGCC